MPQQLKDFGVAYGARVISAHRSPDLLFDCIKDISAQGVQYLSPVQGVPILSKYLKAMDSLLSIVQMPEGISVAAFAMGEAGAANTGLFAIPVLALYDAPLALCPTEYRKIRR